MGTDLASVLLDSWDRQCRIVSAVAGRIDASNRDAKPSPHGLPLSFHLAHMHATRRYFLGQFDERSAATLPDLFRNGWENPVDDLDEIRRALDESARAVRSAVAAALAEGREKVGWYDHPLLYLQHMIWHEGWHVGMLFLGLRLAGQEPPEEWEEANVWSEWRTEVY